MSPEALGYIEGGAGDEVTLADNVAAWRRWALRAAGARRRERLRPQRDAARACAGRIRVIVAPTAFQRLAHPDGELAIARAAAATDTVMCVSTFASAGAGGGRRGRARGGALVPALRPHRPRRHPRADRRRRAARLRGAGGDRRPPGARASASASGGSSLRDPVADIPRQDPAQTPDVPAAALYGQIDPDLRWSDIERFAAESRAAGPGQGDPHRRGRRAGRRPRRRGRGGLQSRRPPARHGAVGRRRAGARSSTPSPAASTCSSTAASGGAPTSSRRWRSAPRAVLDRPPGDVGPGGRPAPTAPSTCWRRCWRELVNALALVGCPRAADLDASFVTAAPWAGPPR